MTTEDPASSLECLQQLAEEREQLARAQLTDQVREEAAVVNARQAGATWRTIADLLGADRETLRRKYQDTAAAAGAPPTRMKRCTERTRGQNGRHGWCRKGAPITVAPPSGSREEPRQVCEEHARRLRGAGWRTVTT